MAYGIVTPAASQSDIAAILVDTGTDGVVVNDYSVSAKTRKGVLQVIPTTIDLAQAAAAYDLFTGSSQDFVAEALVLRMPATPDMTDDATITSVAIATDDAEPTVFFDSTAGALANLTQEAQIAWTGAVVINVGSKVQLTIAGGAADATTVAEVWIVGRASADGGTVTV